MMNRERKSVATQLERLHFAGLQLPWSCQSSIRCEEINFGDFERFIQYPVFVIVPPINNPPPLLGLRFSDVVDRETVRAFSSKAF